MLLRDTMSLSCKNINREENEVKMLDLMSQVYGGKDPERTAEQWLREHKDVKKGQNNFLISLFLQEEEDFFRLLDELEMIYECDNALKTYSDMTASMRTLAEAYRSYYAEDIAGYYVAYSKAMKNRGKKPEGIRDAVGQLLKFYNALQVINQEEQISFEDNVWKEFEEAEKMHRGEKC